MTQFFSHLNIRINLSIVDPLYLANSIFNKLFVNLYFTFGTFYSVCREVFVIFLLNFANFILTLWFNFWLGFNFLLIFSYDISSTL